MGGICGSRATIQPSVDVSYVNWHTIQVFRSHGHRTA